MTCPRSANCPNRVGGVERIRTSGLGSPRSRKSVQDVLLDRWRPWIQRCVSDGWVCVRVVLCILCNEVCNRPGRPESQQANTPNTRNRGVSSRSPTCGCTIGAPCDPDPFDTPPATPSSSRHDRPSVTRWRPPAGSDPFRCAGAPRRHPRGPASG